MEQLKCLKIILFVVFLCLLPLHHIFHFASFTAAPNLSLARRYAEYLARPFQPLACSAFDQDSMYTAEEKLYFTTGQGDRDRHQARLVQYVRQQLVRPSGRRLPTSGKNGDTSQIGQSPKLDAMLKGRRDGFFIECGAADGVWLSNTLFFETERNWTGLLAEANPKNSVGLLKSDRNAFRLTTCLSTLRTPAPMGSAICLPLQAALDAIGVTHVDLFSLDTDGAELNIMKTLDWERVEIDLIMVEFGTRMDILGGFEALLVKELGLYELATSFPGPITAGQDAVFRRKKMT